MAAFPKTGHKRHEAPSPALKSVYTNCKVLRDPVPDQHSGANFQDLFDNVRIQINLDADQESYPLFVGGGAGYWKPTHGPFSTLYNVRVDFSGGAAGAKIVLKGPDDGPEARLIGIHDNRGLCIDYGPNTYLEGIN